MSTCPLWYTARGLDNSRIRGRVHQTSGAMIHPVLQVLETVLRRVGLGGDLSLLNAIVQDVLCMGADKVRSGHWRETGGDRERTPP